jgi:putative membrane-bound dehydrogenase-like protein
MLAPIALVVLLAGSSLFAMHRAEAQTAHGDGSGGNPAQATPPALPEGLAPSVPKIKPLEGFGRATIAVYPLVDDPVAFTIDDQGHFYFAESDRQERGVEDNRSSSFWLLDDLASETVEDRLRIYEKWAAKREGGMAYYSRYDDRVSRLADLDGDGVPESRTVFAGPFNEPLDGTGAGVIAFEGDIFYTNIPHLWRLTDLDGDGVAERRVRESSGYGVRVALRGHDMHGLAVGYDGKIYWSIGDRGYSVRTADGALLHDPRSGAVFRMNPDGSELELFATGLRNPQELAFDNYGNLFTGDNNSDGGDKARFVYIMEGGETGWSMDYQTLEGANQRGPWNQEGIWHLRPDLAPHKVKEPSPLQPAWTLPPLDHVGAGPSGLAFSPGVGLPERYREHFFLCDFLGGDSYSRILAFGVEPVGAGFRVVDEHVFVANVLPTDVDFGFDGRMYMTDWGGGWESGEKGELYAVWHDEAIEDPRVAETTRLMREGFAGRDADELASLLAHGDRRVRQRAQFALAARGRETTALLGDVARNAGNRLARIHAVWALGQQAARLRRESGVLESQSLRGDLEPTTLVLPLLDDRDAEIRAQAARMLGESRAEEAGGKLMDLCADDSPRVRAFAAMALGRIGAREAHPAIVSMIAENADRDVFLRHAGVQALAWLDDRARLGELAAEPVASLRLAAVLAMRKLRDPRLAQFLDDPERTVRHEAARAINDIPMPALRARLAQSASRFAPEPGHATGEPAAIVRHALRREVWRLGRTGTVEDLREGAVFARTPDESGDLAVAESPRNAGNQFIARISGTIEAPETGDYIFAIASDDDSILRIGATDDPTTLVEVARVEGYTNPGDYASQQLQRSQPIRLEQGRRYAIHALHAEGGGGDHCSIAWWLPSGRSEQPIGAIPVDRSEFPHMRRAIEACLAEGTPETAALVADIAVNDANPLPMRLDALEALAAWTDAAPRNRVNGAFRALDLTVRAPGSDAHAAFKAVLARRLAPLSESTTAALRSAARDVAAKHGVSLDPDEALRAVGDASLSVAERVSSLRSLAGDAARIGSAIETALASDAALLRAEARSTLLRRGDDRALAALADGVEHGERVERQRAVSDLASLGASADDVLAPLAAQLVEGSLDAGLRLEVVEAAMRRQDGPLSASLAAWSGSFAGDAFAREETLALEGGDAERGRAVVFTHMSAVCLKCHAIAGSGGDAAPALDGIAARLSPRSILLALVEPNAEIAKGYANVGASAMPSMREILTEREIRDVVAYLRSLE